MTEVEAVGKNLLIRFDNGLELRTHLRMNGSWHRYSPGERWRRPPARARLVLEVPGAVAVCFDAPVVELLETRAEGLHPALAGLGPDLLDPDLEAVSSVGGEALGEGPMPLQDPGLTADPGPSRPFGACATPRGRTAPSRRRCSTSAPWPASATSTRARSCSSSGSIRGLGCGTLTTPRSAGSSRPLVGCSWRTWTGAVVRDDGPVAPSGSRPTDTVPRQVSRCGSMAASGGPAAAAGR